MLLRNIYMYMRLTLLTTTLLTLTARGATLDVRTCVFRRQILTSKVDFRTVSMVRVKIFIMAVDP